MSERILDNIRPTLSNLHALQFAGTVASSRVDSPNSNTLNFTANASIEGWFIITNFTNSKQIFGQGNTGSTSFYVAVSAANTIRARIGNGTTSVTMDATVVSGSLAHICLTYDVADAGGTGRLYINGIEANNVAIGTGISIPADKTFSVGHLKADAISTRSFIGKADNIRAYNRTLTPTEVLEHYNGVFNNNTGLVLNWKMDNGIGLGVSDLSGNNNHGTFMNTTEITWVDRLVDF